MRELRWKISEISGVRMVYLGGYLCSSIFFYVFESLNEELKGVQNVLSYHKSVDAKFGEKPHFDQRWPFGFGFKHPN